MKGSARVLWIPVLMVVMGLPWTAWPDPEQPRGIEVVPLAETQPQYSGLKEQSFGVFVGVNQFEDSSVVPLRFCSKDAREVRDCFVKELGYIAPENARLLVTGGKDAGKPSYVNIVDAIQWAADSAGPEGCIIIQISTHGIEGYVLAEDSRRRSLSATAISLSWIENALLNSRCKRRVLIFDACREKVSSEGERGIGGAMSGDFASAFAQAEGFLTLKSCSSGQYSYEMDESGHGAFTHFLLKGLRGSAPADEAGLITVAKLAPWVREQVEQWSRGKSGGVQVPLYTLAEATGDLPLAVSRAYLTRQDQEKKEEILRQLAQMLVEGKLTSEQFDLAKSAVENGSAEAMKVVDDLLVGRIAPDYLKMVLPGVLKAPKQDKTVDLKKAVGLYTGMTGRIDQGQANKLFTEAADSGNPVARMWKAWLEYHGWCGFKKDKTKAQDEAREVIGSIESLAAEDDPDAVFLLSCAKEDGLGVAKDLTGALEGFKQAARQGNSMAMHQLGLMYEYGRGVQKDMAMAVEWYRKGAEDGNPMAMKCLGIMYANGRGVEKSEAEALEWYHRGAGAGEPTCMCNLGVMYTKGLGVEKDKKKAVEWYQKGAEAGHALAMCNLGIMLENGSGIEKDEMKAVEMYRKSAAEGESLAMKCLGVMYENGRGVEKDDALAAEWYRKGAEGGNPAAMKCLGVMYENGRGVEKDLEKAVEWYLKGAEAGEASAMKCLGVMYDNGRGVEKDEIKAVEWYLKGAEAGNPTAMHNLAVAYANGKGIAKNDVKAVEWYRKGAEGGEVLSMCNLGYMYENGRGVEKDLVKAFEWYRKGAEGGDPTAMGNLGNMYENGKGVAKDSQQAVEWYRKAAGLGSERAQKDLQRLKVR